MKIGGVMLGSDNPGRLGEFYTKVLGEPGWHKDDWYGYGKDASGLMIGPHSEVKGSNAMPGRLMISLVTDDVRGEFTRIKDLGTKVVAEPYLPSPDDNPDMWLATFADPDGNYFQLSMPWE